MMKLLLAFALTVVCWAEFSCPAVSPDSVTFLVASASANTGGSVVKELSKKGYKVRALFRNTASDKAVALSKLHGVTVIKGDFDDLDSIAAAMKGVNRALLVSAPFDHLHFDHETDFLAAAKAAGLEAIVRISTASGLIAGHTQGAYGRAHFGIEAFAVEHQIPVINIRSNWFFDNWLGSIQEIKTQGQISWPVSGDGAPVAMVDPRDVASASATILALPSDQLALFIQAQNIEVHGPSKVNFQGLRSILSKAIGYEFKINTVPAAAWQAAVESGWGLPRTFARSFLHTVEHVDGKRQFERPQPQTTSPLLYSIGWKAKYDAAAWAKDVKALFAKK